MNKHCDLHLHLGGSISKDLLVEFAKSDNNKKALDDIEVADVLQMFKVVHNLINSPKRIEVSTENVIHISTADYLEIRTTPRNFSSTISLRHYVEAFVSGLQKYPEKAKGLLSIDRYKHDIAMDTCWQWLRKRRRLRQKRTWRNVLIEGAKRNFWPPWRR